MLKVILLLLSLVIYIIAAPVDDDDDSELEYRNTPDLSYLGPAIFGTPKSGNNLENWNENSPENPEELGEYAEGDILFPENTRNGLVAKASRWKDGVVPYEIVGGFSSKDLQVIQRAIDIYHKYTCIKFRKREASDTDYLSIRSDNSGCYSSVGRTTGRQVVNLQSPGCTTKVGTPMHELMHAIGFLHEQNRWERDDFVDIVWYNIQPGHTANFNKADKDTTYGYGVPYDYRSVMHYSPYGFSSNGKPTIVPKDPKMNSKMGQREGFTKGDIMKINAMYECKAESIKETIGNNPPEVDNNNGGGGGGNGGGLLGLLFQIIRS